MVFSQNIPNIEQDELTCIILDVQIMADKNN